MDSAEVKADPQLMHHKKHTLQVARRVQSVEASSQVSRADAFVEFFDSERTSPEPRTARPNVSEFERYSESPCRRFHPGAGRIACCLAGRIARPQAYQNMEPQARGSACSEAGWIGYSRASRSTRPHAYQNAHAEAFGNAHPRACGSDHPKAFGNAHPQAPPRRSSTA